MRKYRLASLSLLAPLALAACGQKEASSPAATSPGLPPAPVASAPAAPSAAPRTDATFDQRTSTRGGSVAFSTTGHLLQVVQGSQVDHYATLPVEPLTPARRGMLEAGLAPALRYPAAQVTAVSGTMVRELRPDGNELIAVTYHTGDSVDSAKQVYDRQLAGAGARVVATPLGTGQVVVYYVGMGARRQRVLIAPAGAGARVEVTQSYLAGAAEQEFEEGQGVLQTAAVAPPIAPAAPPTPPATAAAPAAPASAPPATGPVPAVPPATGQAPAVPPATGPAPAAPPATGPAPAAPPATGPAPAAPPATVAPSR